MRVLFAGVGEQVLNRVASGIESVCCGDVAEIAAEHGKGAAGAAVVQVPLRGRSAVEVLAHLKAACPDLPVLLVQDNWQLSEALYLGQMGAFQLLSSDVGAEELNHWLRRAGDAAATGQPVENDSAPRPWKQFLVGESWAMKVLGEVIRLVAPRRCTVLISGETGTGKEMVARALHACSPRAEMPLVPSNCSALPAELLEAELFGHVKGAFTGAFATRQGRIERAHRGTLFLDEIGEMPLNLQAKLLRVLQEREFQPVGSSETIRVDIRVIAATNASLDEMVRKGAFREDLYYRLNVAPIYLPPLRQRASDIPLLARHFVARICRLEGLPPKSIAPAAMEWLMSHPWPGNVRQLENAVEMAVALSGNRTLLTLSDFAPIITSGRESTMFSVPEEGLDYNMVVDQFERNILERALQLADGSKKKAAELLRLKRTTFAAKLKSLRIDSHDTEYDEEAEVCA